MELLLYLFGNWLCIGAASIVLFHYLGRGVVESNPEYQRKRKTGLNAASAFDDCSSQTHNSDKDLSISKDLLIMLFISSLVRVYWSMSPPPLYSHEEVWIQYTAILDMVFTCLTWGLCVLCANPVFWNKVASVRQGSVSGNNEMIDYANEDFYTRARGAASHAENSMTSSGGSIVKDSDFTQKSSSPNKLVRWQIVTTGTLVLAVLLHFFLPTLSSDEAWPLVDVAVIFNLILDGAAVLPQVVLVTSADKNGQNKATHFLGLLCLGRVFRMVFWLVVKLSDPTHSAALWTFVIPDTIHTLIMADYLYLWIKKVKTDTVDPFLKTYGTNV